MRDSVRQWMNKELDKIYAMFPQMECQGICEDTCGQAVTMTGPELIRLAAARPTAKLETLEMDDGYQQLQPTQQLAEDVFRCRLLEYDTFKCSAYEDRPAACRFMYTVENYLCPHGCVPSATLTEVDLARLLVILRGLEDQVIRMEGLSG